MKRILFFIVIALGFASVAFSQQAYPRYTERVVNTGTDTIMAYMAVQFSNDTTRLLAMDTTGSLTSNATFVTYVLDTTGKATGTYNYGKFADTLANKGEVFQLIFWPVTTPSTDTVWVYGDTTPDWRFSHATGRKKTDVIAYTTAITPKTSTPYWTGLDSIRIKTGGGGSDSIKLFYRIPNGIAIADSGEYDFAGITTGKIAKGKAGTVVTFGHTDAWVDGATRYVSPGDHLVVSRNGKLNIPLQSAGVDTASVRARLYNIISNIGRANGIVRADSTLTDVFIQRQVGQ